MPHVGIGTLRRSQVVFSYGPGATIDLPDDSVIIGGLDWWRGYDREQIIEPRLAEKAAHLLGVPRVALFAPPVMGTAPNAPLAGIPVEEFPKWFVAEYEERKGSLRSRPLLHRFAIDAKTKKYEREGKKYPTTPVRFVQACPNGHIADIEWWEFAHKGPTSCRRPLWLDEQGTSGDLTDMIVRCECGESRPLAQAKTPALGQCKGQRPWLPRGEQCVGPNGGPAEMMRLLIRTASNAYFAQRLSVLSLPDATDKLRSDVERLWTTVSAVTTSDQLAMLRGIVPAVREAFPGPDDQAVLDVITARREGRVPVRRKIKVEEYDALSEARESIGEDVPDGLFFARRRPVLEPRPPILQGVDRIVLVHRLREVSAQVGFTRFEAIVADKDGELDLPVRRAELASEPSWLPAVETRGEGVFISFDRAALDEWRRRPAVVARDQAFRRAHARGPHAAAVPPDITHIMLHTLSHLLISAIALDCGYASGSLRERIYVGPGGCGILIYTGTADAEGTLGGLVQVGNRLERYLRLAKDLGRLCSNDPVCAQHAPDAAHEDRLTLGAACHACVLISETCCEFRNELLDRALVVGTVDRLGCEFLRDAR